MRCCADGLDIESWLSGNPAAAGTLPRVPDDDDACADLLVGAPGAGVSRRKFESRFACGEPDESIVDSAAGDTELAQYLRQPTRGCCWEDEWARELVESGSRVRRCEAQIPGQPGENGIRLGERMPG
jgi:hypothetical protein